MTMRKLLMLLPLAALVAACGDKDGETGHDEDSGHEDDDLE